MAIENVKKFFELVKSDEELAREIAKIKDEIQNKGETVDYEQIISKKVIPMAKKHGLDFTMEDFLKYTNSMVQQGELSGDDLLNVSGGMNFRQGLATGLLMLTVGTTGLSLMGNFTAPGSGGSGSGGQGRPGTSFSQNTNNGAEDGEDVDTESGAMEDNEFNDGDDITPTAKGASMDMLGAGMFDDSEDEADTQGGAGELVSTNKDATGGGAEEGSTSTKSSTEKHVKIGGVTSGKGGATSKEGLKSILKNSASKSATAGGGAAGGAAGATTATKATAGGAGAGAAGGTTTTTAAKKDEAAKPGAEAAKKDETKEETKTETGKKSEEAKKDEAAKTEATEKQEYNKFGDVKWHLLTTSWQDIGNHILGELNNVGLDINNFSNISDATSDIGAFVKDAKKDKVDRDTYNKIKTAYDNYTAEVAKKEIKDLVESIKRGNDEETKLGDFWDNSSINEQGITWKGCVLSGEDAITLLDAYSADYKTNYEKGKEFTCALYNEDAQNVEDAAISELKDLLDKLNEGIKDGKTAAWPQELKDRLENFRTELKDLIAEKEEAAKKEAEAKKAAEEAAKKEAEAAAKKAEEAYKTGKWDYTAISVEESNTGKKMTLKEKIDHISNFRKNFESLDQVKNPGDLWQDAEDVFDLVKNAKEGSIDSEDLSKINEIMNLRDEFNKKDEAAKAAEAEAAKKDVAEKTEAEAEKKDETKKEAAKNYNHIDMKSLTQAQIFSHLALTIGEGDLDQFTEEGRENFQHDLLYGMSLLNNYEISDGSKFDTDAEKKSFNRLTVIGQKLLNEQQKYEEYSTWSKWSTIESHILKEMEKVNFNMDNFSNKEAAEKGIKYYLDDVKSNANVDNYNKIETAYNNYMARK